MTSLADQLRRASDGRRLTSNSRGLPPRSELFVGRDTLVARLSASLGDEPTGRRVLITGQPGVGKTAVALELAHKMVDLPRYDFVVWLDCHPVILGTNESHPSPYALGDFAAVTLALSQAVGAMNAVGCGTEQRSHVLRSWLSQHRTLLVLDGVDKIFDVALQTLLERLPFTVDVIVTCRAAPFWGESLHVLPISSTEDFRQIVLWALRRHSAVPNADNLVPRIEALAQGLPMTALWVASLLSRGETIEEIELGMKEHKVSLSEYYFADAWRLVSSEPTVRKVAVLMSVLPQVGSERLAAVLAPVMTADAVSRAIRRLEYLNLLVSAADGMLLRSSARDYVLAQVGQGDEDVGEVVSVAVRHQLEASRKALGSKDWPSCFLAMEPTRPMLVATLNLCRDRGGDAVRLEALQLLGNVAYYLFSNGLWDELLSHHHWSTKAALTHGALDSILEVSMTWIVRVIDRRAGEEAAANFMAETEIAMRGAFDALPPDISMKLEVARAVVRDSHRSRGDGVARLMHLGAQLWADDSHEWACRAMLQAGNLASESFDVLAAERSFRWVLEHAHVVQAPWARAMEALSAGNLGILCNRTAEFRRARSLLESSISGLPQLYDVAVAKAEMARACFEIGHLRQARSLLQQSHTLVDAMDVTQSIMESHSGWDQTVGADLRKTSTPSVAFAELGKRVRLRLQTGDRR